MSGIVKMLTQKAARTSVGIIKKKNADGTYTVASNGKEARVKSSLSFALIPGNRVLLSETTQEVYIFGKDNVQRRQQVVVSVDG